MKIFPTIEERREKIPIFGLSDNSEMGADTLKITWQMLESAKTSRGSYRSKQIKLAQNYLIAKGFSSESWKRSMVGKVVTRQWWDVFIDSKAKQPKDSNGEPRTCKSLKSCVYHLECAVEYLTNLGGDNRDFLLELNTFIVENDKP